MSEKYEKLILEMPKIAEVVKKFPENMQKEVFDRLVTEFNGSNNSTQTSSSSSSSSEVIKPEIKPKPITSENNFAGICTQRSEKYHFTARDLKAKSARDAAKRLIYVVVYSYKQIMGEDTVSRKEVLNPLLEKWRLNNANTRGYISNDRGILQNGDLLSLDFHAEKEAKMFITEILDENKEGKWSPESSKKTGTKSNKTASKSSSPSLKIIKNLDFKPSGKKSFLDFIEEKKPKNQNDKCTIAIYYMTHQMEISKVSAAHVKTAFKFAKWLLPANLPNRLSQAGTEGFLEITNLDEIELTSIGENLIEHKLPKK